MLQGRDHGERAHVHERVGGAVEEDRRDAAALAAGIGREADKDVPGVGDRGVGQHPLDVVLRDRHQVA